MNCPMKSYDKMMLHLDDIILSTYLSNMMCFGLHFDGIVDSDQW